MNRYSRLSFEKNAGMIYEGRIIVNENSTISLHSPSFLQEEPSNWVITGPLLFRNPENGRYMSFVENKKGEISHMNTYFLFPYNSYFTQPVFPLWTGNSYSDCRGRHNGKRLTLFYQGLLHSSLCFNPGHPYLCMV